MAVPESSTTQRPVQCNADSAASIAAARGTQDLQATNTKSDSLGYFLLEAKYGPKLVVKQQLIELRTSDTFRTLLLRVLKHEALKERGSELRIQVAFRLGRESITVPSADEVVSVVLQRFPDIKSLQYTIQPFESEYIKVEPIRNENNLRARLFQVLGWTVRVVGAYELFLLAMRLGLRVAGVAPPPGMDTDMAETVAFAEALVQMNSEELDEFKRVQEVATEDFIRLKEVVSEERRRRKALGQLNTGGEQRKSGENADSSSKKGQPWVSSGEEDNSELDGSLGRDAGADYDATSMRSK